MKTECSLLRKPCIINSKQYHLSYNRAEQRCSSKEKENTENLLTDFIKSPIQEVEKSLLFETCI